MTNGKAVVDLCLEEVPPDNELRSRKFVFAIIKPRVGTLPTSARIHEYLATEIPGAAVMGVAASAHIAIAFLAKSTASRIHVASLQERFNIKLAVLNLPRGAAANPKLREALMKLAASGGTYTANFTVPVDTSSIDVDQADLGDWTVERVLHYVRGYSPTQLLALVGDARLHKASKTASSLDIALLTTATVIERIRAISGTKAGVCYLADGVHMEFPGDFDNLEALTCSYYCERTRAVQTMSLTAAIDTDLILRRTIVLSGGGGIGKTRLAHALAARFCRMFRVQLPGATEPQPPEKVYWLFARSIEALRGMNELMGDYVPFVLDEFSPRDRQCDVSIDGLKNILDITDPSTVRCRHHDLQTAKYQTRIITTNATMAEWVPMEAKFNPNKPYTFDMEALARRWLWVDVGCNILRAQALADLDADLASVFAHGRAQLLMR